MEQLTEKRILVRTVGIMATNDRSEPVGDSVLQTESIEVEIVWPYRPNDFGLGDNRIYGAWTLTESPRSID